METIVEEVLRSPRARLYVDEMQAALRREDATRQRFRDEFRDGEKAEFINGEVIVHSPSKSVHIDVVQRLSTLLATFARKHELGVVKPEKALVALTRNDYEPDVCFWRTDKAEEFKPDQMLFPAPDLVVEVLSPSTEQRDRGVKFEDYAAHGIAEYWIIDPDAQIVEQYVLRSSQYALLLKGSSGNIRSLAMEGFVVPIESFFNDSANLAALQTILSTS